MAIFTVHVPPRIANASQRADRTIFVRDGFSLPAFLFGPMFLLYRRLWFSALAWIVAAVLLGFVSHALRLGAGDVAVLLLLLGLLTGLEASALRQGALGRRGYMFAALLSSPSRDEAERAFFASDGVRPPLGRTGGPGVPGARGPGDPQGVIGLFPQAGDSA